MKKRAASQILSALQARRRLKLGGAVLLVLLASGFGVAQPRPGDDRALPTSASLPESPDALLLSGRALSAIQAGDYRVAIDLIRQLGKLDDGLVAAPASRTFYTVHDEARRLLGRLPEAGLQVYRQMFDAEAAARFEEAREQGDLTELRRLFDALPLTTAWNDVGRELATRLLDEGRFESALEVLEQMGAVGPGAETTARAMAVVGLASLGAQSAAERLEESLRSAARANAREENHELIERLSKWLAARRAARTGPGGAALDPLIGGPRWMQNTAGRADTPPDAELASAISDLRRFPLQSPIWCDGELLVRVNGDLAAYDGLSLAQLWRVREPERGPMRPANLGGADSSTETPVVHWSLETQMLLGSPLRHALGVGFGLVLTVEEQGGSGDEELVFSRRTVRSFSDPLVANELIARRIENGDVVWRAGDDPQGLFNVAFQDRPLPLGQGIATLLRRGDELRLAVLDPNDGSVVRDVPVVGPPSHFTRQGGRAQLECDPTSLYVCTGNGVVAAFERESLRWKWATVYPSTLVQHMGRFWWRTDNQVVELAMERPVVAGDLLIVAPIDALEYLAFDRVSGRERWRLPRRAYWHLLGQARAGLIVAGTDIACLDLADPVNNPPRWRSVPLRLCGRPLVQDERIYAPTPEGLVVLDAGDGRVIADEGHGGVIDPNNLAELPAGDELIGANLVAGEDGIYAAAPDALRKFPDARAVQARCTALAAAGDDGRAALAGAWVDMVQGNPATAIARLEAAADAPVLRPVRNSILTQSCLKLAQQAASQTERVSWLRKAEAYAAGAADGAQLGLAIAAGLERAGVPVDAALGYALPLARGSSGLISAGPDLARAAWLSAGIELRRLWANPEVNNSRELPNQIAALSKDAGPLAQLRLASWLPAGSTLDEVQRRLATVKLAPELAVQALPEPAADLSVEQRAGLTLRRWEVYAALGAVAAARQERDRWQSEVVPRLSQLGEAAEDLVDRAQSIGVALKKQEQTIEELKPERISLQWRMENAELLLDPEKPLAFTGRHLLVRNREDHKLQLIDVWKNQGPLRVHDDGLIGENGRLLPSAPPQHWENEEPDSESLQVAWPVLRHGMMAATPAPGGLVCLGLGPERGGGGRLWQAPLGDGSLTSGAAQFLAACDAGVCVAARRDRLQLLDWLDGRCRWQVDSPGAQVDHVRALPGWLIVLADDGDLSVRRAEDGALAARWASDDEVVRGLQLVGNRLVVWTDAALLGLEPATLTVHWKLPTETVVEVARVEGAEWLAYRTQASPEWQVLDATNGSAAISGGVGTWERINAAAWDGSRLLIAGVRPEGAGEPAATEGVGAYDLTGRRIWTCESDTRAPVQASQLLVYHGFVPVLQADTNGPAEHDGPKFMIALFNRETGRRIGTVDIEVYAGHENSAAPLLIAMQSRLIVQLNGQLMAFGNSMLSPAP